jgi:hypothetical protein
MPAIVTNDIEEALAAYLLTLTGVTALVGTRISPVKANMKAGIPRIVYQLVEDVDYWALKQQTGVKRAVIQLKCWGTTAAAAKELAHEVCGIAGNRKLNGFRGPMPSATPPYIYVQFARCDNRISDVEEPAHAEDGGEHCRILDVTLIYNEATA